MFADVGFAGRLLARAATVPNTTLHIGREPAGQRGFAVNPRRWVVERTFARLTARGRPAIRQQRRRFAALHDVHITFSSGRLLCGRTSGSRSSPWPVHHSQHPSDTVPSGAHSSPAVRRFRTEPQIGLTVLQRHGVA
ncbi:hypothetical protein [Actinomycetospora callitridis]|uniref:hypothetical protein n=1 Tax=Actinomycetospora callitridis TaxID=913944 RepID=UPI003B67805F